MQKVKPKPTVFDPEWYALAAMEYSRTLTDEDHMEGTAQATQRKIKLESMDVVRVSRPDVQTFNELLIQYPKPGAGKRHVASVCPDNMIVVHPEPIVADGSYALEHQPVGPLVVLEYVSKSNGRKDFERNMILYEKDVKVPYFLVFYPDVQELNLYKLTRGKYRSVVPGRDGRRAIPELELGVALRDEWVRYWFRGELVPLPEELVRERDAEREGRLAERERRLAAEKRAAEAEAANARLLAELERLRGRG
jgi:hypothetical protein